MHPLIQSMAAWPLAGSHHTSLVAGVARLTPERLSGWVNRSHALHQLGRTQEAYDALHAGLYRFWDKHQVWYDLACYSCTLGNMKRAGKLLD